jgi:bile acid:Na+ symporter, BASS family
MHSSPGFLEASIIALVLGLGLRATPRDAGFLACRPRLLLRAFVAMDLLVPLVVIGVLSVLSLPAPVIVGATLLSISPGGSLLAQKELAGQRSSLVLGSSILGALLSIVTVPVWLGVVSQLFLTDAFVAPAAVTRLVGVLFVLPLALAMILRRLAPELMAKASGPLIVMADVLLLAVLMSFAGDALPGLQRLGLGVTVAFAVLGACTVLIGHWAGGPDESDRSVLAVMSGARHPGLALLVARYNFDGDLVLPAVIASLFIGTLVTLPYVYWCRQRRLGDLSAGESVPAESPILAPPASQ